jgi:putative ABC transport system permease protein
MQERKPASPPPWAIRFLRWYCDPALVEDLEGDLNEYFNRNLKRKGLRYAKIIFLVDVLKFFRLYTLRKPTFINLLIQWMMMGSYIKTSGRNIVRNKLFSSINIIGLAISMAVGLLMIAFLADLLSYDRFHEKADRTYRVISHPYFTGEQNSGEFPFTSVKAGMLIREKFTGVEDLTIVRSSFSGDARVGENRVPLSALYADNSFLKVFTFPLIAGNPENALQEPYSLVLTENASKKLFGEQQALGRSVRFDSIDYIVTGILKDVPFFSHIRFESLISFSTAEREQKNEKSFLSWTNLWDNYVYLTVHGHTDMDLFQSYLDQLCEEENKAFDNIKISLQLQPLTSIVLGKRLARGHGPLLSDVSIGLPTGMVWVIGGLAFIVILSACFNYTNLSMARSLRRSREVGIRKVMGALRSHVFGQFLSESTLISLMAFVLAIVIFWFLKPYVLSTVPEWGQIVQLEITAPVAVSFLLFALVVGVLAGFLPALFFSKIQTTQVLKNISTLKVFKHVGLRKVLMVVQYTFSLIFITATFIGLKQYKHFLSFDLGFSTENVLNIDLQGNHADLLEKELKEIPEVESVSQSMLITSVGNYWGGYMKYLDPQDSGLVWSNGINEQYIPLHRYQLLAGRNFTIKANNTEGEVIVSEQVLKRFGIGNRDPEKALGEIVTFSNFAEQNVKLTIIGVIKDFHYGKMENRIEPVIFHALGKQPARFANVKISATDLPATMSKINDAWKKIDKVHPLEASFYDDQIEQAYSEFSAMIRIIGFLAFLTISISSLGLFGMVVFTTETKLKEVSIRKTLGAGESSIVFLLSKGFVLLLTISATIALPMTYLFFDRVVLTNFPYHLPLGAETIYGFLVVMSIALVIIGFLTLGIARTNPAHVLKNE